MDENQDPELIKRLLQNTNTIVPVSQLSNYKDLDALIANLDTEICDLDSIEDAVLDPTRGALLIDDHVDIIDTYKEFRCVGWNKRDWPWDQTHVLKSEPDNEITKACEISPNKLDKSHSLLKDMEGLSTHDNNIKLTKQGTDVVMQPVDENRKGLFTFMYIETTAGGKHFFPVRINDKPGMDPYLTIPRFD